MRILLCKVNELGEVSIFHAQLSFLQPKGKHLRRWLFLPYDQLSDQLGPLSREPANELGIVLVESSWKAKQRPYHQQKIALILANMRHFALEQAKRGVKVRYLMGDGPYHALLSPVIAELGPLRVMRPAERELRADLVTLFKSGGLIEIPHEGWLTTADDFAELGKPPWRMDAFYRVVRKRTNILMERGKPVGGKFSFDSENRKPWRGEPATPSEPTFPRDEIKDEVCALIKRKFANHPGTLREDHLPATKSDADALWQWAMRECLPKFGPHEDAMSTHSTGLFHSRISQLQNLLRLLPSKILAAVLNLQIPLSSKEGFVRQILGWREFVHHVHEATDGFRNLPANVNAPIANQNLPQAYWQANSGLNCLDSVVKDVWHEAYSHHITRLMILGNIATLLAVQPRQITDWFWVAYADAYDWVVEPNVMAMASHAFGELMTTKPYISGSGYIHRMSDYCKGCKFDPKKTCPLTKLYWHFLEKNSKQLSGNIRMAIPLRASATRTTKQKKLDAETFITVTNILTKGNTLTLADMQSLTTETTQKKNIKPNQR
ncbi:deoxyribodipyrimidine photo-lyase [Planctomycetota bacterium]|nr:deoxyribodipyrimidine photo-lyase [Planctomycetota bacterium]